VHRAITAVRETDAPSTSAVSLSIYACYDQFAAANVRKEAQKETSKGSDRTINVEDSDDESMLPRTKNRKLRFRYLK
jgi:hypothetical protein